MPHNKDQQFNPQFYLRNFSVNESGKSINFYNIALAKCIFGASIAGQCARPYFYGKDGRAEAGLGMLEDASAPMFRRMISERKLPPRHSAEHGLLGQFIAVQHGRTQANEAEVSIRRSIQHNRVTCIEGGWAGSMLRRHLTTRHGLTPDEYRARWNLPHDHAITAPAYSERRSTMAKQLGLGRTRGGRAETSEPAAVQPRRRGRPRSAAMPG